MKERFEENQGTSHFLLPLKHIVVECWHLNTSFAPLASKPTIHQIVTLTAQVAKVHFNNSILNLGPYSREVAGIRRNLVKRFSVVVSIENTTSMKQGCARSIREKRFTSHWERDFGKPSLTKLKGSRFLEKERHSNSPFAFGVYLLKFDNGQVCQNTRMVALTISL